jgi:dihydrofolate reductase
MAKIIAGLFTSVDGVVEAPDTWSFPYFDDEVGAVVGSLMKPVMLLGRVTWAGFAEYFTTEAAKERDPELAAQMTGTPKYVVSTTLESADGWDNSTLLGSDWAQRLREIKAGDGPDLGISGSVALIRSLIAEGLLDELHLIVHPLVVGKGARLFPEGSETIGLELVTSATLSNGTIHVAYAPQSPAS